MKKTLFVFILIFTLLISMVSCNNTDVSVNNPIDTDPIESYDKDDISVTEDFITKAKKYDYNDGNVVILSAENQSDKNYTVTVDMTYYDEAGQQVAAETQTFEGFSSNWQKYFLFNPGKAFSSYEYKISTEEFNGECYGNKFTIYFKTLKEDRSAIMDGYTLAGWGKAIYVNYVCKYEYSETLDYICTPIVFDNKGEIYYIGPTAKRKNVPPYSDNLEMHVIFEENKESIKWPEELKGDTNGILILNAAGKDLW